MRHAQLVHKNPTRTHRKSAADDLLDCGRTMHMTAYESIMCLNYAPPNPHHTQQDSHSKRCGIPKNAAAVAAAAAAAALCAVYSLAIVLAILRWQFCCRLVGLLGFCKKVCILCAKIFGLLQNVQEQSNNNLTSQSTGLKVIFIRRNCICQFLS